MRVHNFGAGPCTLPFEVLAEAEKELLDYRGAGMSLVEMSHRSVEYDAVHRDTLDLLRRVAGVPAAFDILFVQGGATLQFAMVPMNLLAGGGSALVGDAYAAWDGAGSAYTTFPASGEVVVRENTRYLHVTTNETIGGIRMVDFPDVGVPLVADMSSEYLARPIEWDRYDLVYGGVQKNLAPSGLAVVFVRSTALDDSTERLPAYLRYRWHADSASLGNTPAMFPIYIMGKVLEVIEDRGGIEALERESADKAAAVYEVIDTSGGFYLSPVAPAVRSHMNVVFRLPSQDLETAFLAEARRRRMVGLKGHRSVGGIRASLYAACRMESVEALTSFMRGERRVNPGRYTHPSNS
jgi:phosphoserine aminotransferase